MTPYLQLFCWGNYREIDRTYFENYLNVSRPKLIEYISQEEWAFSGYISDSLIEYADKNDVEVRVLLNSYDMWNDYNTRPRLKNIIYEDCPTLVMNYVLEGYAALGIDTYNQNNGNPWIYDFNPSSNYSFKIISMTNKAHWWRSKMIDHYAEYEIINDNNCIIWHNYNGENNGYEYKFFKPRTLAKDPFKDKDGGFNSFMLPRDFSKSWFSAVYETDINIIAMSEKVFTPLLYMKPFIVLGSKGYHQYLKSLGFHLFEEFIDYSFDLEDDAELRIEKYCREIAKINELSFEQIAQYNDLIRHKLIHNKKQIFDVFFDQTLQPTYTTYWKDIIPTGKEEILSIDRYIQENFYRATAKRGWYKKVMLPF